MEGTVRKAQAGDREAFKDLYLAHHEPLYRFCLSELRNPDEAEEAVQETFVKAWRALGSFRGEAAFLGWLYRIARNLIIDAARRRKRHPVVSLDEPIDREGGDTRGDRIASRGHGPEAAAIRSEEQERFREALNGLPEIQRTVYWLREAEGLDYREIATRLGLAEGTVKSRLARARDALLAGLSESGAAR